MVYELLETFKYMKQLIKVYGAFSIHRFIEIDPL